MRFVIAMDTVNAQNTGVDMTVLSTSPFATLSVMDAMDHLHVTVKNALSTATWLTTLVFATKTGQKKTAPSTLANAITYAKKITVMDQRAVIATTVGNMRTLMIVTTACATMIMKVCIA